MIHLHFYLCFLTSTWWHTLGWHEAILHLIQSFSSFPFECARILVGYYPLLWAIGWTIEVKQIGHWRWCDVQILKLIRWSNLQSLLLLFILQWSNVISLLKVHSIPLICLRDTVVVGWFIRGHHLWFLHDRKSPWILIQCWDWLLLSTLFYHDKLLYLPWCHLYDICSIIEEGPRAIGVSHDLSM